MKNDDEMMIIAGHRSCHSTIYVSRGRALKRTKHSSQIFVCGKHLLHCVSLLASAACDCSEQKPPHSRSKCAEVDQMPVPMVLGHAEARQLVQLIVAFSLVLLVQCCCL